MKFAIGIDLGGTKISRALINNKGKLFSKQKVSTEKKGGIKIANQILELINEEIKEAVDKYKVQKENIRIGIAVPGIVWEDKTVWAPNLPGWEKFPLEKYLEDRLNSPVFIESDRNASMLGEKWLGKAKNIKDAVYLIIGTGVGAGILIDGQIYKGANKIAGAVGWLVIEKDFLRIYKEIGCLEAKIAGPGIARRAIDLKVKDMNNQTGEDNKKITSKTVFQAAKKGDINAKRLVEEVATEIGLGIANILSVLDPEVIIIGGGLSNEWGILKPLVYKAIKKWGHPQIVKSLKIETSLLGEDAGLFGAAKLAFQKDLEAELNGNGD